MIISLKEDISFPHYWVELVISNKDKPSCHSPKMEDAASAGEDDQQELIPSAAKAPALEETSNEYPHITLYDIQHPGKNGKYPPVFYVCVATGATKLVCLLSPVVNALR
jgi:hypothetical protein